jgi:cell division septal protein FtsQ
VISGRSSALPEPDRRYWRSRFNRRVRKARWARTVAGWSRRLVIQLAITAVLLAGGVRVFQGFTTTDEFALEHIDVQGAHRVMADSIAQRLEAYRGRNVLDLNLHEIAAQAAAEPWVLSAEARRVLPRTLRVRVSERRPAALALIDGVAYVVDATGHVVGPSGPGLSDDLPVLRGLDGRDRETLVSELRRGAALIERLRETAGGWVDGVSELDLSQPDRVELRTVDPGPRLLLDPRHVERNLLAYLELRAEIERRVGPALQIDLRWADRIPVKPLNGIPASDEGERDG